MTPVHVPSEQAVIAALDALNGRTMKGDRRRPIQRALNAAYDVDFPNDYQDLRAKIEALLEIYEKLNNSNARKASESDTAYFDGAYAETQLFVHTLRRILAGGEV